jgi:NADH-quinone oxidoreductase subunit G
MLGLIAQADQNYALMLKLASQLAKVTSSDFSDLPAFSNTVGGNLILDANTTDLTQWLIAGKKVFINIGVEPEADCVLSKTAIKAMQQAELVVNFAVFDSEIQREYADVLLPIAPYAENAGTLVNIQQDWQTFKLLANAKGEAKPLWKVLRVLGNMLDVSGFDYVNTSEILNEITALHLHAKPVDYSQLKLDLSTMVFGKPVTVGCYSVDSLVRRSAPLQATPDANLFNQSN